MLVGGELLYFPISRRGVPYRMEKMMMHFFKLAVRVVARKN